ncbi:MAG TPA: hypothetical protein VHX67_11520 [Acidimicrobiales bacterium]|jgi:hypothetical protein|nr:hypothetical protein [Acidimicrobiales bacterium]
MGPVPATTRRELLVLARLARFAEGHGLGSPPLSPEVIEAFAAIGLLGRTNATRGTYRSVLRHLAGESAPPTARRFAGSVAKAPYSGAERTELWSLAAHQHLGWRAHSAKVLLALSMGAGLRSGEITALKSHQVSGTGLRATVRVEGPLARTVTVEGADAVVLVAAARGGPGDQLFRPGSAERSYHNFVNDFCATLSADPNAPALSVARCRSSFICDHLAQGTPLADVLKVSGINEVESLLRYARHVASAPQSKAALRARLKEEPR